MPFNAERFFPPPFPDYYFEYFVVFFTAVHAAYFIFVVRRHIPACDDHVMKMD